MTTSGTTAFNLDVDEIVEEAYERCGLEATTGYDLKSARRCLNIMFAEWANRGLNLWAIKQKTTALTASTESYQLDADIIDIVDAVIKSDSVDYNIDKISRAEYLHIPNKTATGRPSQYFLSRKDSPTIYLYNSPDKAYIFKYWAMTYIEDVGNYSNQINIPKRFFPCMCSGLAYYLAIKKAPERIQLLKPLYEEELQRAIQEDRERTSLKVKVGL